MLIRHVCFTLSTKEKENVKLGVFKKSLNIESHEFMLVSFLFIKSHKIVTKVILMPAGNMKYTSLCKANIGPCFSLSLLNLFP